MSNPTNPSHPAKAIPNYTVGTVEFVTFLAAVSYAREHAQEVIEISTGVRRWAPPPPPDKRRLRAYKERQAAYDAYQRMVDQRDE